MVTWCAPAASHTCWLMLVWRTRPRRVPVVGVRSVVRCAAATSQWRRQSPSCRHSASSVPARYRARCYQDTSRRCAKTGSLSAAAPPPLGFVLRDSCRSVCLRHVWYWACQVDVTSANVFAVCSLWSTLLMLPFMMSSTWRRHPIDNFTKFQHLVVADVRSWSTFGWRWTGQSSTFHHVDCCLCCCVCVCVSVTQNRRCHRCWWSTGRRSSEVAVKQILSSCMPFARRLWSIWTLQNELLRHKSDLSYSWCHDMQQSN